MEWFVAFKYLHILAMFFAVGLAVSTEVVVRRVAGSGDVRAIRTTVDRVAPFGNIATAFFMAGVVFGIVAALAGQIDLLAPWLVLAYVGFVGATVLGMTITDPWVARLGVAAVASPDEAASDELRTVIADPVARAGSWALMGLIAFLVFVMVVKPLA